MARSGPPAYAWDWFARQRLLWREARVRTIAAGADPSARYAAVDARSEVVALLRRDYPNEPLVQQIVDAVVTELVFLGRTDRVWADLGVRNPPRGMRWWWSALTGEEPDASPSAAHVHAPAQLSLDDLAEQDPELAMDEVHEGYGG